MGLNARIEASARASFSERQGADLNGAKDAKEGRNIVVMKPIEMTGDWIAVGIHDVPGTIGSPST